MSLVNVSIVGNLVKPPEQMYFASGRVKTTMVVAINNPQRAGRSELADFYRIETWGKLAELAGKYLSKGNQVGVSGRLVLDHWTDKHGKNRITPIVEATQLSLPPKLKIGSDSGGAAEPAIAGNPIGGEVVLADDEETESLFQPSADATMGASGSSSSSGERTFVHSTSPN